MDEVEGVKSSISNITEGDIIRLLVVSSRASHVSVMTRALLGNVAMVQYNYDTNTLDGVLALVAQSLSSTKVKSIAFVFHALGDNIYICAIGEKVINMRSLNEQKSIGEFFKTIMCNHIDIECDEPARMDFIGCTVADLVVGGVICKQIESLLDHKVSVGISNDLIGTGIQFNNSKKVGEWYFWKQMISSTLRFRSLHNSTNHYEKIRVVGKGAFGQAVLYRRKVDDSLVVLKEINMHDLNAQERQLALNEVCLLARLTHPNIITYYDSFEEDELLMIEMEFAEGGNLSQFLSRRERPLEEHEILIMFRQMVSAVAYLHLNGILHRDLKTANIFLKKDCTIKVGDFGISKAMSTQTQQRGANTVLGTPYYISPEMCEGKSYGEKSDMWALGCILYEMACLQKTFEGSNLPALVNKIMKGQYEQVRGNYSGDFKSLVRDLLRKAPEGRPDSQELLYNRLPEMLDRYDLDFYEDGQSSSEEAGGKRRRTRSVLYSLNLAPFNVSPVAKLPSNIRIISVSVSGTHQIIITSEKMAYAWGENKYGELGVGDTEYRAYPCLIESLTGKAVSKTAVGNGFSLFCSENGIILSCGRKDRNGQEGLDVSLSKPKLIDSLLSIDVICMSCGPEHSIVVGEGGKVFVWGSGLDGRLGTSSEWDQPLPISLNTLGGTVASVRCGFNNSLLITESGGLLATGSNEHNKLNLAHRSGIIGRLKSPGSTSNVEKVLCFTSLKNIPGRVIDVSLGRRHTLALLDTGVILAFGCNDAGQLARGHNDTINSPSIVRDLQDKASVMAVCGTDYNLAGTTDNCLYFWGRRRLHQKECKAQDRITVSELKVDGKPVAVIHPLKNDSEDEQNPFQEGGTTTDDTLVESTVFQDDIISRPEQVLRLDISTSSASRQTICLSLLTIFEEKTYLVINTTIPLPHKNRRKGNDRTKGKLFRKNLTVGEHACSSNSLNNSKKSLEGRYNSRKSEEDDTMVQSWIKRELEAAEVLPMHRPVLCDSRPNSCDANSKKTLFTNGKELCDPEQVQQLLQDKQTNEAKLAFLEKQYATQEQLKNEAYKREQAFLIEIATLRDQLDNKGNLTDIESPPGKPISNATVTETRSNSSQEGSPQLKKQSRICVLS